MEKIVDSYRFVSGITKRLVKTWIKLETPRTIPWTPLTKPLRECKVALISSGGIALKSDKPFEQEGERQNPWWGDPSYRIIPNKTKTEDIRVYHMHINPRFGEEDINSLLPIDRLSELVEQGEVGSSAQRHYSFMGYILDPKEFLERTIKEIIKNLKAEKADVVVLVPS